jgi:UTP:GlnB (protein PII) uridylyltransferase
MNIKELEQLSAQHRADLENQLKYVEQNLSNLDRIAHDYFTIINERAEADRYAIAHVFQEIAAHQETQRQKLRDELGMSPQKGALPEQMDLLREVPPQDQDPAPAIELVRQHKTARGAR